MKRYNGIEQDDGGVYYLAEEVDAAIAEAEARVRRETWEKALACVRGIGAMDTTPQEIEEYLTDVFSNGGQLRARDAAQPQAQSDPYEALRVAAEIAVRRYFGFDGTVTRPMEYLRVVLAALPPRAGETEDQG